MSASEVTTAPLVSARQISKSFAGIEVLRNVDLDLAEGEVHALLGENGAGKSTFAKILSGVYRPTRGTITFAGNVVDVTSPVEAQRLGITLIHQEPISFPDLSVAENLVLGRTRGGPLGRVRWAELAAEARRLMALLGIGHYQPIAGSRLPISRWSKLPARSPATAASSSWTNRPRL